MAERQTDSQIRVVYRSATPIMDARNHPAHVPPGSYPWLSGVDGRFAGSFRRFPGFYQYLRLTNVELGTDNEGNDLGDESGDGYPTNMAGDISSITAVWFFKYLEVQVVSHILPNHVRGKHTVEAGKTRTLRGFVVAHDYVDGSVTPNETRGVLRFVYYDPLDSSWQSKVLLQEVRNAHGSNGNFNDAENDDGTNPTGDRRISVFTGGSFTTVIGENSIYDAAAMGPYIYFCVNRSETSRTGASYGAELSGEDPRDYYRRSVHVTASPTEGSPPDDLIWRFTDLGPIERGLPYSPADYGTADSKWSSRGNEPGDGTISGSIRAAFRTNMSFKNVDGPLLLTDTVTATSSPDYFVSAEGFDGETVPGVGADEVGIPTYHLEDRGLDDDYLAPYLKCFRSIDSSYFETYAVEGGIDLAGGTMFQECRIVAKNRDGQYVGDNEPEETGSFSATNSGEFIYPVGANAGWYRAVVGFQEDVPMAGAGVRLKPFDDTKAFFPSRVDLLLPYQGTLLRTGTIPRLPTPAINLERDNVLSWGALDKYAPEEASVANSTPLGSGRDDKLLSMVSAGDYAFLVGDSGVYRVHRNGKLLGINEIQSLAGGVGRYAAVGVGSGMFYVSHTGAYMVDGSTSEFQVITALDRIILDRWAGQLGSIRMTYDQFLGAVVMMCDDADEAVLLWNNTGMVTVLTGMVYKFGDQGVEPTGAAEVRSFWVTSAGIIYTPNAERRDGYAYTMMGGDIDKKWNTTVADSSQKATGLITVTGEVDSRATGFQLVVLRDGEQKQTRTITALVANGSDTDVSWDKDLEGVLVIGDGDKVAIAPVEFEVVGWPFWPPGDAGGADQFTNVTVKALGHSVLLRGGETDSETNPNLNIQHRLYRRGRISPSQAQIVRDAPIHEDPSKTYSYLVQRGPVILPAWYQGASNLDFELLGGIAHGMIHRGDAESDAALQVS